MPRISNMSGRSVFCSAKLSLQLLYHSTRRPMANGHVDEAMQAYGSKEWHFEALDLPCGMVKGPADIDKPLTVFDFVACCPLPHGVKSTVMILDVQREVADCGAARDVAAALHEQKPGTLPPAVQFKKALPATQSWEALSPREGMGSLTSSLLCSSRTRSKFVMLSRL